MIYVLIGSVLFLVVFVVLVLWWLRGLEYYNPTEITTAPLERLEAATKSIEKVAFDLQHELEHIRSRQRRET